MLATIERIISRPLGAASGLILVLMSLLVTIDVISRFFGTSIPGAAEVTENLMVFSVFFALAHTQAEHSNVSMDFIVVSLSLRMQRIASFASKVICLGFTVALFFGTTDAAFKSFDIGEYKISSFDVPLWPSKVVVAFGFLMLTIEFTIQIIRELRGDEAPVVVSRGGDI